MKREMPTKMVFLSSACFYAVSTLCSFAMVPAWWLKCSRLTQLLDALTERSIFSLVTRRRLQSVMWILYVLIDYAVCLKSRFSWDLVLLKWPSESFVFKISLLYSLITLPSFHIFPVALLVTAGYLLNAALTDTTQELEQELRRRRNGLLGVAFPRHQVLRMLRYRYVQLRRLHKLLDDVLAVPLFLWSLSRVLTMTVFTFNFIGYCYFSYASCSEWICAVLLYSLSLFILGSVADGITMQVRKPCYLYVSIYRIIS